MHEIFDLEDVTIDNQSQLMLWELRSGEWERALTLRRAADLPENRQVFYRMEEHLMPAGLVEEKARENPDDIRRFRLTTEGVNWVLDHATELQTPTTREQIQEYALEGYEAGTSAKESVQTYRKKVHRLKRRVERAEDDVDAIEENEEQNAKRVQYLDERTQVVRGRSKRNKHSITDLREGMDERETIRAVDAVREDVSGVEERLSRVEAVQASLLNQQAVTERERAERRALAKPAGYVGVSAVVGYFVVLGVVFVVASGLMASVVIAGIVAILALVAGGGAAFYAQEWHSRSSQTTPDDQESHTAAD